MVNLWPGIPPSCLCDKHLNAACNEATGLLRWHIIKRHKIDGWIENGCIDLGTLDVRIIQLLAEARARGKDWKYEYDDEFDNGVDLYQILANPERLRNVKAMRGNPAKLAARCPKCKVMLEKAGLV